MVHPVEAHLAHSRLEGAGAPFRLRVVRRAELGKGPRSRPPVALWRDHVVTDTAHDIKRLIDAGARFEGRDLKPGDIAVLAARRNELEAVQAALADVGVPSVVNAGGSVFHTPAAGEWLTLLEAMEQPHRADRVRAAALTSFFGHDAVLARRRRRPADRPARRPGPHPGRRLHPARRRGGGGGGRGRGADRPGARRASAASAR